MRGDMALPKLGSLATPLASSLGMQPAVVSSYLAALESSRLLPSEDDPAKPEHAALLLIALLAADTPSGAAEAVRVYSGLPTAGAMRYVPRMDDLTVMQKIAKGDFQCLMPYSIAQLNCNLLEQLSGMLADFVSGQSKLLPSRLTALRDPSRPFFVVDFPIVTPILNGEGSITFAREGAETQIASAEMQTFAQCSGAVLETIAAQYGTAITRH